MALLETSHAGAFLLSEANGNRAREKITVLSGQNLKAGTVLGKVALGAATPAAVGGNTGDGVHGAVTVSAGAKVGVYRSVCIEPATNAGKFLVTDPDGIVVGIATVAVAFSAGGLAFTMADGATDFVSGDSFTITVAAGSGKYRIITMADATGAAVAAGILYDDVDASAADAMGLAIVRHAEVIDAELTWHASASDPEKAAARLQLNALGIYHR